MIEQRMLHAVLSDCLQLQKSTHEPTFGRRRNFRDCHDLAYARIGSDIFLSLRACRGQVKQSHLFPILKERKTASGHRTPRSDRKTRLLRHRYTRARIDFLFRRCEAYEAIFLFFISSRASNTCQSGILLR